jgi:hypothetical protein
MNLQPWLRLLAAVTLIAVAPMAHAQEGIPGTEQPKSSGDPYVDLSKSKDPQQRTNALLAQRYLNLVRLQEWTSASGKSKVSARYVAHDPNMKWVKLAAVTGSGKSRVVKEVQVDMAKLNKACQSRVNQIALLRNKLDEVIAKGPDGTGSPMIDEQGIDPNAVPAATDPNAYAAADPNAAAVAAAGTAVVDSADSAPGADQEDPLGFSEIVFEAAPAPGGQPGDIGPGGIPIEGAPAGPPGAAPPPAPGT